MAGKRLRLDWKFQLKKCNKKKRSKGDSNDRISELPDDILVTILSLLPMKEAARTSVLSPRWINLWKHTSSLDFHSDSALAKIAENYDLLCSEERQKYVDWVNRILRSHKAVILKEFTVCFDLDLSYQKQITQWLEFAFTRHVEKLVLDFSVKRDSGFSATQYTLPEEFLSRTTSGGGSSFKSLRELSLKCANLTGEAIEILLRTCPLLEKLVVHFTDKISNLQVCGPSLVLKHLELVTCINMKSVKVSAPNLVSLIGPFVEVLLLENVPMLKEVSVSCMYYFNSFEYLLPKLSCCISQLEILTLQLLAARKEINLPIFPELPKLKKLVIEYWTKGEMRLMGLTPLIRASPYLQEFVFKLVPWGPLLREPSRLRRKRKNSVRLAHHHLKVFKFCGYYGRSSDVELVRYILKNSVVLEKIIIDPFDPIFCGSPRGPQDLEKIQTARDYAKQQLKARVPHHVELVIL